MIGDELYWFLLVFWFIFILFGIKYNKMIFKGASGIIGICYGLIIIQGINLWIGLITIITGIGLFYDMIFGNEEE